MTRRVERLEPLLREALQRVFDRRDFQDPRISGLLTVTGVRLTPDLARATVRVSVLPHDRLTLAIHGLRDAAGHIRRRVGGDVRLRRMPDLVFEADESSARQAEVLGAIARGRSSSASPGAEDQAHSSEGGEP